MPWAARSIMAVSDDVNMNDWPKFRSAARHPDPPLRRRNRAIVIEP
jgi:hypothetical protein